MLILKNRFVLACLATSLFMVSCENTRGLAVVKGKKATPAVAKSNNPKFLDDVTVGGTANSNNIKLSIPKTELTTSTPAPAENNMLVSTDKAAVYSTGNLTEDKFLSTKYSLILGILPGSITNYSLYGFIEEWYGTRYRMGGKTKSGIDCSAFVQTLYDQVFGTSLLRTACEQFSACVSMVKDQSELQEGDLVFFKIKGRRISHVGVYLANNYFVHASSSQGVMISSLNESYWSRYYAGGGKM
jgi:lipoprotein Spr